MPRDPKGMICSLFTVRGWYLHPDYVCSYSILHVYIKPTWKYSVYIHAVDTLTPLFCRIYVVTVGKPLLSVFVFQWNELKMQLCVCVCVCVWIFLFLFMCVLITTLSLECATWFIAWPSFHFWSSFLSLSLLFPDALLLHFSLPLNISRCRIANMKPWTPGTTEQRAEL